MPFLATGRSNCTGAPPPPPRLGCAGRPLVQGHATPIPSSLLATVIGALVSRLGGRLRFSQHPSIPPPPGLDLGQLGQTVASFFAVVAHGSDHCLASLASQPPRCHARFRLSRQVVIGSDVSSSSDMDIEESMATCKVGKRVCVTTPVRVHQVAKAPDIELCSMESIIKQYVSMWKGKRITANLPFKVEFELKVDGKDKPVWFLVHLREEEFEIMGDE